MISIKSNDVNKIKDIITKMSYKYNIVLVKENNKYMISYHPNLKDLEIYIDIIE